MILAFAIKILLCACCVYIIVTVGHVVIVSLATSRTHARRDLGRSHSHHVIIIIYDTYIRVVAWVRQYGSPAVHAHCAHTRTVRAASIRIWLREVYAEHGVCADGALSYVSIAGNWKIITNIPSTSNMFFDFSIDLWPSNTSEMGSTDERSSKNVMETAHLIRVLLSSFVRFFLFVAFVYLWINWMHSLKATSDCKTSLCRVMKPNEKQKMVNVDG